MVIHGSGFAKKTSPFHIQSKIEFAEEGTLPDIRLRAFMIHTCLSRYQDKHHDS